MVYIKANNEKNNESAFASALCRDGTFGERE